MNDDEKWAYDELQRCGISPTQAAEMVPAVMQLARGAA